MVLTINGFDFPMSQDDAWDVINYARERMIVVQPGEEIQPDMIIPGEELKQTGTDGLVTVAEMPKDSTVIGFPSNSDGETVGAITEPKKYKGFLLIRCDRCGKLRAFNARNPISEYRCSECGAITPLPDLKMAYMDCTCGAHFKYKTNETAMEIRYNCLDCGKKVKMNLNSRGTTYVTARPRKRGYECTAW